MRITISCLLLALLTTTILAAPSTPAPSPTAATLPAPDFSTPRAAYITYQRLLLAADLNALETCIVPPASAEDRDAFRSNEWPYILACAMVNHFGPEKAAKYATRANEPISEISLAETATQTITGDTAQLITPSRTSINLRKIGDQWRVVLAAVPSSAILRARQKSDSIFAAHLLTDLQSGDLAHLPTVTDVENQLALHESALAALRRVEPIYLPPNLDPQGLRVKVVATPAATSTDHLFHIDAILQNAGQQDLNVLLGIRRHDNAIQFLLLGSLEATDRDGVPTQIPMINGMFYSGSPPIPWIVTLHPGDTFPMRPEMPFGAPKPPPTPTRPPPPGRPNVIIPPHFLPPGTYTFTATAISFDPGVKNAPGDPFFFDKLHADPAQLPLWTGTVVSEPVIITVPKPTTP